MGVDVGVERAGRNVLRFGKRGLQCHSIQQPLVAHSTIAFALRLMQKFHTLISKQVKIHCGKGAIVGM